MSIIEKYRMITRYGVAVFLAAAACFSGFAVDCNVYYDEELDVWWWECGGQLEGPWAPGEGGGSGNCTNCVQTSPAECESIKASVSGIAEQINQTVSSSRSTIDGIRGKVQDVRNTLNTITDEGEQFVYYNNLSSVPGGNATNRINHLLNSAVGPYLYSWGGVPILCRLSVIRLLPLLFTTTTINP